METHELQDLSEIYLSQRNIASETKRAYRIAYKHYINYLKDHEITYAKTSDVISYRDHKRMFGHSSHYIYIQICALKGLYRYLKNNQDHLNISSVYLYDVLKAIKNENIKHHIKKPVLSLEQARHLILHTKKIRKSIWHYRDHAIIYLMLTTALRTYEVIHAKREDYQMLNGSRVLYVRQKNENLSDEFVNIPPGLERAIEDYLNKRKDDLPYLFVTTKNTSPKGHLAPTFFSDMFKRVLKACGLDGLGITPHCLRHSAAIMNLLRGGSLEATKSLLRHKDIQSTLVYKDYLDRLDNDSEIEIDKFILKEEANHLYMALMDYLQS